jgi:SAM-dependent methyltransferase
MEDMFFKVENNLVLDENSIWILPERKPFSYADGSEKYIEKVISHTNDLSSNSYELEKEIRDWPSEYHLSRKRSQLLRGFDFNRSKNVLEVGCGCGAITRFLGENFDHVVSIEGSQNRAKIARLRTKGMKNVNILCAPFQEINFREKFDLIFCIGVFEYSAVFVDAEDPFDLILEYFNDVLTPDGSIIIAIENQFGLKYFSSSREDHTGVMFDGIEGYTNYGSKKAKTFGYGELKSRINMHFKKVDFYFPYPDYKTPSCVLSHRFLTNINAGELIGKFETSPYLKNRKPLFNEKLATIEIEKNRMLPHFSNSFLVVAGKHENSLIKFNKLGIIYSENRVKKFQTVTTINERNDFSIVVNKSPINGSDEVFSKLLSLRKCESEWYEKLSIHAQIMQRIKERDLSVEELFKPIKSWFKTIYSLSNEEDCKKKVDGKYIDCIWSNCFNIKGQCKFIDIEWKWHTSICIKTLLIRSFYSFFNDILFSRYLNRTVKNRSRMALIKSISKDLGIVIRWKDFKDFCKMEAQLSKTVYGKSYFSVWISSYFLLFTNIQTQYYLSSSIVFIKRAFNQLFIKLKK